VGKVAKRVAPLGRLRRRHPELHEHAPVDVGIQNNFSNPRTPMIGKACRCSASWPSSTQLERQVDEHGRVLVARHRQQPGRSPAGVEDWSVTNPARHQSFLDTSYVAA
jgi:hypothetical protein